MLVEVLPVPPFWLAIEITIKLVNSAKSPMRGILVNSLSVSIKENRAIFRKNQVAK
jgi:hypothetical protein